MIKQRVSAGAVCRMAVISCNKRGGNENDSRSIKILKELKTVKEQLDTCPENRDDLRAEYQARYDVIEKYAPQQMSAEEIRTYLEEKFAEVLATKNKGQIMKAVMGDLKGKADGKLINQVVAEICQ